MALSSRKINCTHQAAGTAIAHPYQLFSRLIVSGADAVVGVVAHRQLAVEKLNPKEGESAQIGPSQDPHLEENGYLSPSPQLAQKEI